MAAFQTTEGTMELGGAAALVVDTGAQGMSLVVAPTVGYFVADNLEVVANFGLLKYFDADGMTLSFGAGAMYYMDMDMFIFKTGVALNGTIPNGGDMALGLAIPLQALFPMNDHVALVTGATVNLNNLTTELSVVVPVGYLSELR